MKRKLKSRSGGIKKNKKLKSNSRGGTSAKSGFATAKVEAKQAKRNREKGLIPFRFFLRPGHEGKVIITSREPFFLYEHHYKGQNGKWNQYEPCIKATGHCPLCTYLAKEGYYAMYVSVIDLSKYTDRNGKVITKSQKLLPVKLSSIPKFERMFAKLKNNFRGAKLRLIRDGDKDPAIGNDFELLGRVSEEKLSRYGEMAKEFDFKSKFSPMSEEDMRRRFGTGSIAGSEDFSTDDDDDDLDDIDWD